MGTPEQVALAVAQLSQGLQAIGVHINLGKSVVWTPDPSLVLPECLRAFRVEPPTGGVVVLGSPVGSPSFVRSHLKGRVEAMGTVLERLRGLGDRRAESQILRSCLGPCRVNHLLRTLWPGDAEWLGWPVK